MDQKEVRSPPPTLPSSSEKDSEKDSEMDSEKKEVSSPPTEDNREEIGCEHQEIR